MSTKLSLLSRAALIAGVVALGLPAFAQTSQPAAPSAAPATTTDKAPAKVVDQKTGKSTKHTAKKSSMKTAKNTHKSVMPAPDTSKPAQPSSTGAGK